jgi:tetratricopeptide (TPR) repeat protein
MLGLAAHDFVFPGERTGMLRFKHGITRDVVYQTVGLHTREQLHLRIAQALLEHSTSESPEQAYEALAYHFGAARHWSEAARYAELSGDKAVAASALDRAKAQYRAALSALDQLPPSAEVYGRWTSIAQRLGLSCVFDASRDELEVFRRAVAIARASDDLRAIARAEYWLGYINYAVGETHAAVTHCERALEAVAHISDEPLRVQIRATLGQVRQAASQYPQALVLLDEAIAIKRRFLSGTRTAVGFAYSVASKAAVLGDQGSFREAYDCFDEALEGVIGSHHEVEASITGLRAAVYLWQGRWEEAIESSQHACRVAERVRSLFSFSMSRAAGAYAQWMLDGRPQSLHVLTSATSWLEPRRIGLFRSLNFGWLSDALVTSGRIPEARHHAARGLSRARELDRIGVAMTYRALARAASKQGDRSGAERYLALATRVALDRESRHEIATTQWCAATIELEQPGGDRAKAASLLDQACIAFVSMEMPWHLDRANRLRETIKQ